MVEPGSQRNFLAIVAAQVNDYQPEVVRLQALHYVQCLVTAAIIDVDSFTVHRQLVERRRSPTVEFGQAVFFVVGWDDN